MIFLTLTNRRQDVRIPHYLIDWEAKSLSRFQWDVKQFLKPYWGGGDKVICEEMPVAGTRMRIDIVNVTDKVAVEIQGDQHNKVSAFFHGGSLAKYKAQIKRDLCKAEWCEKNGFTLVEIMPADLPLTAKWFLDHYQVTL